MFDLSKKQHEVLSVLGQFARIEGRMPSVRELAEALALAPATTQQHLRALCDKGYLQAHGRAHGLELLPRAWAHLRATDTAADPEMVRVPVIGSIAAGIPLEAIENSDESLSLPRPIACPGDFLLRVRGESLIDDGILDGDLVLIRPHARVHDGDIAVALLPDGSATLKHVHFESDAVVLKPANRQMPPLRVRSVTIQGRMVGLWRCY
jgi:repressor LexA